MRNEVAKSGARVVIVVPGPGEQPNLGVSDIDDGQRDGPGGRRGAIQHRGDELRQGRRAQCDGGIEHRRRGAKRSGGDQRHPGGREPAGVALWETRTRPAITRSRPSFRPITSPRTTGGRWSCGRSRKCGFCWWRAIRARRRGRAMHFSSNARSRRWRRRIGTAISSRPGR